MSAKKQPTVPGKSWQVATGHRPHMTGGGTHDTRPREQRTRSGAKRAAIIDSKD